MKATWSTDLAQMLHSQSQDDNHVSMHPPCFGLRPQSVQRFWTQHRRLAKCLTEGQGPNAAATDVFHVQDLGHATPKLTALLLYGDLRYSVY